MAKEVKAESVKTKETAAKTRVPGVKITTAAMKNSTSLGSGKPATIDESAKAPVTKNKSAASITETGIAFERFRFDGENIYYFDPNDGYFKKIPKPLEMLTIQKLSGSVLSAKQLKEAIEDLKLTPEIYWKPAALSVNDWLVQENGKMFNIKTKEMRPSLPNDENRWKFNYVFSPEAQWESAPNFCRYVKSSVGVDLMNGPKDDNKRKLLLQIIVYMCSNLFGVKGMFVIIGNPSSGKSQFLNLIRRIIGIDNCAAMTLEDCASRFRSSLLEDIHCIINDELPCTGVKNLDQIKKLICNEFLTIERKGKDVKSFKPTCKLLFAGNQLPILAEYDSGNAFARRLKVLRFPNSIPEEQWDYEICDKMYAERNAIVSAAIKECEDFIGNLLLAEDPEGTQIVASYMAENDSVRTFTEDSEWCSASKKDHSIKTYLTTLYEQYKKYCNSNSLTACTIQIFRQQLAQIGFALAKCRAEKGGVAKSSVLGIALCGVSVNE